MRPFEAAVSQWWRILDAVMGRIRPLQLRSPFGLSRSRQLGSPDFQNIVGQGHQGKLPGHLVQNKKNSASRVKMFKETQAEDRTLTLAEYYKVLEVAPEYFKRVIIFACNTAMRRSEILNLKFGQIKIWPNGAEIELLDTKAEKRKTFLSMRRLRVLFLRLQEKGKLT